jgi:hypothetical protein
MAQDGGQWRDLEISRSLKGNYLTIFKIISFTRRIIPSRLRFQFANNIFGWLVRVYINRREIKQM